MTSSGCQGEAAGTGNPGEARKARRCTAKLLIGRTCFDFLIDSGAEGGNCIDSSLLRILPPRSYRYVDCSTSVCLGINKCPVRIVGKVLIDFQLGTPVQQFRAEFNVIENLVHPIVIGLPFLQKNKAILSFERDTLFIGNTEIPLAQARPTPDPPPPHLAAFRPVTLPPLTRSYIEVYSKYTSKLHRGILSWN